MARTKKEKVLSEAQKHTLDMRQKLELANKAHADKPTKDTEAKVSSAKSAVASAIHAENRERFERVGGTRVKKARVALRNLGAVSTLRSYTYTESDVAKVESVLGAELKSAVAKMRAGLTPSAKTQKAEDDFTF